MISPLRSWRRFHRRRRLLRWPIKNVLFVLVVAATLYPKPWLLPRWIARLGDMNAVLEPQHPGLEPFERAVRGLLPAGASPTSVLKAVEKTVYARIPYAWDWDVWGVMDYLPTVGEVLAQGREDCDGRAGIAASRRRRLGA